MSLKPLIGWPAFLCALASALPCAAVPAIGPVPPDSDLHRAADGGGQRLLASLTAPDGSHLAGWKLEGLSAASVTEPRPRLGATALRLSADANDGGAKADVGIFNHVDARLSHLGLWVHLPDEQGGVAANVDRAGLQLTDAEGETFMAVRAADWQGWQWVEFPLGDGWSPAYHQPDKNGTIGQPLRHVNVVWFTRQPGPTRLTVNALIAAAETSGDAPGDDLATLLVPDVLEPEVAARPSVRVSNPRLEPLEVRVDYRLQTDPQWLPLRLPDPVHGTDHALFAPAGSSTRATRSTADRSPTATLAPGTARPGTRGTRASRSTSTWASHAASRTWPTTPATPTGRGSSTSPPRPTARRGATSRACRVCASTSAGAGNTCSWPSHSRPATSA